MNYLLRHSIDDNTKKGGWSQAPLTEEGIILANTTANALAKLNIKQIVCSDLQRAKETAEIINQKLNLHITYTDKLREFNAGIASGKTYQEIDQLFPTKATDYLNKNFKYPEGETLGEFQNRIIKYYNDTIKNSNDTLFITHRNVISVIHNYINNTEWNFLDKTTVPIPHCALFSTDKNNIKRIL